MQANNVNNQVMWNRMISIVEEQAQALIRTAFSTSVREAGDLSAGLYNRNGEMLTQAVTGTPGHVNAMAESVGHFISHIGLGNMAENDVYVTNDPWLGTGHLHDITVVTPSFVNGNHIGFFACTAHVVDIGGRGFGADANSIYEEGFYIPIMKLMDKGAVDHTLINLLRINTREPDQLVGDLYALVTCNEVGHNRLVEMMSEFELSELSEISHFILDNSHRATVEYIKALPNNSADGSMIIDGYQDPITLKVNVDIQDEIIVCDFAGTSKIDNKGINVPLVYTKAYACYALKCAIAPEIPNNAASLAPFQITAPVNSILNAVHPAPVALRHVIGHMVPDTVYDALDKILPNKVPAEGAGTLCNFQVSIQPTLNSEHTQRSEILTFNSGGSGARPTLDGMNATAFPSGVMTMPVEATEHAGPIVIWRKELRPDSGGSGEFRGGLGQYMEVGVTAGNESFFSAMFDRVNYPARGRKGGGDGAATTIGLDDGSPLRGKGKQFISEGKKVMLAFPGGAGYGDAKNRDSNLVKKDLAAGFISAQVAADDYHLSQAEIDSVLQQVQTGNFQP